MKNIAVVYSVPAALVAVAFMLVLPARAQLIQNGGFESGLISWTAADQFGSDGSFLSQSGAQSPVTSFPVPTPPGGTLAAMTDAQGPGSHVLYQDFVVPVGFTSGLVSFSLFVGNSADDFHVPTGLDLLDFSTAQLNQQARVDILSSSADPFSIGSADVLQNLFQTQPGDQFPAEYQSYSIDISPLLQSHQGQTIRLRFAEVDNVNIFNFGVDNVSINPPGVLPDSSSWLMCIPLLVCLLAGYRSRAVSGSS
jgi:hypothetical protein